MKLFTLLVGFLSISFFATAQTGRVEGKITDAKSGTKISAVSVTVDGASSGVASNVDGNFVLTLTAGKKYSIKLTLPVYIRLVGISGREIRAEPLGPPFFMVTIA